MSIYVDLAILLGLFAALRYDSRLQGNLLFRVLAFGVFTRILLREVSTRWAPSVEVPKTVQAAVTTGDLVELNEPPHEPPHESSRDPHRQCDVQFESCQQAGANPQRNKQLGGVNYREFFSDCLGDPDQRGRSGLRQTRSHAFHISCDNTGSWCPGDDQEIS